MVYLLQGHDSKTSFETAAKMSQEERKLRLRTLRNQREEWRVTNSSDSSVNYKILQEGKYTLNLMSKMVLSVNVHNLIRIDCFVCNSVDTWDDCFSHAVFNMKNIKYI